MNSRNAWSAGFATGSTNFCRKLRNAANWQKPPDQAAILRAWRRPVACPECKRMQ